jgi:hypothetical protein
LVLREGKRLSPTVLEVRTKGPELTYRLHVHGSLGNREDCSIDVVYDPTFRVVHWLGPNGEDDVDPRLRSAVEPILLERAAGHDADSLTTLLLDRSQGDSQYDRFISDHPVVPIAVPPPNRVDAEAINPENWLPITIPFGDKLASPADRGTYASYDGIDGDVTPLRVDGRHLLLAFGFPVFNDVHQLPDFGFGIWAWDGHDFQAVAGGYMGKSGNHPYIH